MFFFINSLTEHPLVGEFLQHFETKLYLIYDKLSIERQQQFEVIYIFLSSSFFFFLVNNFKNIATLVLGS